jgi:hypothetical protein
MNCRRIEKLIPLYVEGDLDIEQADAVRSHAKSCANCGGLVAEYEESQRWLRSFMPPHFDDALLDDLKLGVLKEIKRQEMPVPFLNRLAGHWTRRLVLASSVALLIIFGVLALYNYQDDHNDLVAGGGEEQKEQSPEVASPTKDVEKAPRANSIIRRPRHTATARRREVAAKRRTNPDPIVKQPGKQSIEPAVAIETDDWLLGDPATSEDMLRIEIQTSDPNIRIIWFSPKENNSNPSRPITDTE